MYSELTELYPSGKCNRTDPILRHDLHVTGDVIVKAYTEPDDVDDDGPGQPMDMTSVDGIYCPIVKLNNMVIDASIITYFKLDLRGFTPVLNIHITDASGNIEFSDVPGMNNVITVVFISPIEGVSKKISMNFYITGCNFMNGKVMYTGEYRCTELDQVQCRQVCHDGCSGEYCGTTYSDTPSTYETFHEVARACNLSFAASQHTQEISDRQYRILPGMTYKEYLQRILSFAGTDEYSIMDGWVDWFNTLILMNVSWVMNEDVAPNELSSTVVGGEYVTDTNNDDYMSSGRVHRTLTNYAYTPSHNNLMVAGWRHIVNNSSGYYRGTTRSYNYVLPVGNGGVNGISSYDVSITERSLDGVNQDQYNFAREKFDGFEMGELHHTLVQKNIRTNYFDRLRANILEVTLERPNFVLERGMLVNLVIYTYDAIQKRTVSTQISKATGEVSGEEVWDDDTDVLTTGEELEPTSGIIDISVSGQYYIDGITLEYNTSAHSMVEKLYCVRKGDIIKYANKSVYEDSLKTTTASTET